LKKPRWGGQALAAGATCVALLVLWQAGTVMRADTVGAPARRVAERWAAEDKASWTLAEWERTRVDLETAVVLTPDDATLYEALAQLYGTRGRREWTTGEPGTPGVLFYQAALQQQLKSVAVRPRHANAWANLALLHYAVNSPAELTYGTWRKALALGPHEPEVRATLMYLAQAQGELAPEDIRAWAVKNEPKP
jgi:tetratricopeptide (TPR) repeat protein